jgi:hypothetical protein
VGSVSGRDVVGFVPTCEYNIVNQIYKFNVRCENNETTYYL